MANKIVMPDLQRDDGRGKPPYRDYMTAWLELILMAIIALTCVGIAFLMMK